MDKTYLTPEELAERWNIKTSTLSQWRWSGQGPVYSKIGKTICYWPHDVKAYEMSKRRRSTSDLLHHSPEETSQQKNIEQGAHLFEFLLKKKRRK